MVLRLYPAGLLAVIVVLFMGVRKIAWRDWARIAIASLAGNLGYQILAAYGMQTVPASWTGLLFGLEPVFIALFAVSLRATGYALAHRRHLRLDARHGGADAGQQPDARGRRLAVWPRAGDALHHGLGHLHGGDPARLQEIRRAARGLPRHGDFRTSHAVVRQRGLSRTLAAMDSPPWMAVGFVVVFGTFLATSAWNHALGHDGKLDRGRLPLCAAGGGGGRRHPAAGRKPHLAADRSAAASSSWASPSPSSAPSCGERV